MKIKSSLFTKMVFWFFLNLTLIVIVLGIFFALESQVKLRSIFGRQSENRMRIAGHLISHDLDQLPKKQWNSVLARYSQVYQVDFVVLFNNGLKFASSGFSIPKELEFEISKINRQGPRFRNKVDPGNPGFSKPNPLDRHFMKHTQNPSRYWSGIRIWLFSKSAQRLRPAVLLAASDSITGNGFFFDPVPWITAVLIAMMLSVLLWIPMVRHITQPLARMTLAAEEIAKGKFEVVIRENRTDEIGRLAKAINHMTSRLGGYVKGQKRFLGDVAHELGSPIARIQLGLGILEHRVDPELQHRVSDVVEDVTHMSNLVNELLSFTRAEINPGKVKLEKIHLLPVVQRVLEREKTAGIEFITQVDQQIRVIADSELLARALANLIRNAIRYAGAAGPISIIAEKNKDDVIIQVRDQGHGVPDDLIDHLFEPFYRIEPSRDRDSGGVGLGLAIVKTCIETCQGTVSAQNHHPEGFSVMITLES